MNNLFSIGEVSKYQNISKQTLIFYDKIGLFKPAFVDPDNGYRYYSSAQLDYLDTILIMKKIGFSLREIRQYMQNQNIDNSLLALNKQLKVIDDKIEELRLIRSRVANRCEQMENANTYNKNETQISVEHLPTQYILFQKIEEPYSLREISIATKKCFAEAFGKELPIFFQTGVSVPYERIEKGRFMEAAIAFLPIEKTEKVQNIKKIPMGKYAYVYHFGEYQSIGCSYEKLLNFCRENSLSIISDSYEFCINDYITSYDESEFITKIMFRVK